MSLWLQYASPIVAEILFLSIAIVCVHRAEKNRIYPAFWQLLIFLVVNQSVLLAEGLIKHLNLISGVQFYNIYFFTYWPCFLAEAILVLRVIHEMFRHSVRAIPGVQKMGRPIFFWAIAVSIILACASGITPHQSGMALLLVSAQILMRSQSVLALCMLAFLAFASHTLGISFRSRIFGVIFGFGLMATADLVSSALFAHITSLAGSVNLIHEAVYLAAIAVWAGYFIQPEPVRRLVTMPSTSPLMRWNEIAQTLGNPAGQFAVSYPPSFMTDVHQLVNSVMGEAGWPGGAAAAGRPPGPIAS